MSDGDIVRTKQDFVAASEAELAEAIAAVFRGTNLVVLEQAGEWGAFFAKLVVRRIHERQANPDAAARIGRAPNG